VFLPETKYKKHVRQPHFILGVSWKIDNLRGASSNGSFVLIVLMFPEAECNKQQAARPALS
jgi:hypothetical protein